MAMKPDGSMTNQRGNFVLSKKRKYKEIIIRVVVSEVLRSLIGLFKKRKKKK